MIRLHRIEAKAAEQRFIRINALSLANAITKVAKSGNSSEGATLYVTASPCIECSKLIIQAGIRRVVYRDAYRLQDGPDLLRKSGIEVEQVDCE